MYRVWWRFFDGFVTFKSLFFGARCLSLERCFDFILLRIFQRRSVRLRLDAARKGNADLVSKHIFSVQPFTAPAKNGRIAKMIKTLPPILEYIYVHQFLSILRSALASGQDARAMVFFSGVVSLYPHASPMSFTNRTK